MKLCRIWHQGAARYGVLEGESIVLLARAPFAGLERTGEKVPLAGAQLLAPTEPSKIVCVGLNYRAHAAEMGKPLPKSPLLFMKPASAVLAPGGTILLPPESGEVHHEAELGVVIGRKARRVTASQAADFILGYTCLNDVTARDIQRAEGQYTRAKGFDTFAPFGPLIETELDPRNLAIKGKLNGQIRQQGSTADMVFDPLAVVAFASAGMTLLPGDVLATGTPPGVGPLAPGDTFEVEIEGVGVLRNVVRKEE